MKNRHRLTQSAMVQMWPVGMGHQPCFSVLDVVVYQEDLGWFVQILRFCTAPDSLNRFQTKRRI